MIVEVLYSAVLSQSSHRHESTNLFTTDFDHKAVNVLFIIILCILLLVYREFNSENTLCKREFYVNYTDEKSHVTSDLYNISVHQNRLSVCNVACHLHGFSMLKNSKCIVTLFFLQLSKSITKKGII